VADFERIQPFETLVQDLLHLLTGMLPQPMVGIPQIILGEIKKNQPTESILDCL
jgi:hypothetical protein